MQWKDYYGTILVMRRQQLQRLRDQLLQQLPPQQQQDQKQLEIVASESADKINGKKVKKEK